MNNRQGKQVPYIIQNQMMNFLKSLPSNSQDRQKILNKYSKYAGYEFIQQTSTFNPIFKQILNKKSGSANKSSQAHNLHEQQIVTHSQMDQQLKVEMMGSLQEISVGAMCEIVKQYMRQECPPYFSAPNQSFLQEFSYQKDQTLVDKVNNLFHEVKLSLLDVRNDIQQKKQRKQEQVVNQPVNNKLMEFRKQMTMGQDGSLGSWGGSRYEGLGSRDEFSNYRREVSQNYYNNAPIKDKKK